MFGKRPNLITTTCSLFNVRLFNLNLATVVTVILMFCFVILWSYLCMSTIKIPTSSSFGLNASCSHLVRQEGTTVPIFFWLLPCVQSISKARHLKCYITRKICFIVDYVGCSFIMAFIRSIIIFTYLLL